MDAFFHISLYRNPHKRFNADVLHKHGHHELIFCANEKASSDSEQPLVGGDLYFYPAGSRHGSAFMPGHEFEIVLAFDDSFFIPAIPGDSDVLTVIEKMSVFEGKVPLSEDSKHRLMATLEVLLAEFRSKGRAYHAALKMLTMRLMILIARDTKFASEGVIVCAPPSNEKMVREILAYIDTLYMQTITVDSVLEFCPISRSHFHAIFRRITGKTFLQHITSTRIEKAKELLVNTDYSVAKIAQLTGFSSPAYFGQTFRTATGTSPGEFRKHRAAERPDM
ncbi:MAG: helix-turn-helix transcriptional regulator [Planctomycetota bacterium]